VKKIAKKQIFARQLRGGECPYKGKRPQGKDPVTDPGKSVGRAWAQLGEVKLPSGVNTYNITRRATMPDSNLLGSAIPLEQRKCFIRMDREHRALVRRTALRGSYVLKGGQKKISKGRIMQKRIKRSKAAE